MRHLIVLLILGSIATSASAAGTDIHGLIDARTGHTVVSEQQSIQSLPMSSGSLLALSEFWPRRSQVRSLVTGDQSWNKLKLRSGLMTSRIGLGTWAMGGWMWGGTDEAESIATIRSAIDYGVTLIDTAPVYGFGRSEEIVGKALEGSLRHKVTIATKVGLAWKDGAIYRDSRPARIRQEIEDSLRRLRTDVIDLYQMHWPDFETPDCRDRADDGRPAPRV